MCWACSKKRRKMRCGAMTNDVFLFWFCVFCYFRWQRCRRICCCVKWRDAHVLKRSFPPFLSFDSLLLLASSVENSCVVWAIRAEYIFNTHIELVFFFWLFIAALYTIWWFLPQILRFNLVAVDTNVIFSLNLLGLCNHIFRIEKEKKFVSSNSIALSCSNFSTLGPSVSWLAWVVGRLCLFLSSFPFYWNIISSALFHHASSSLLFLFLYLTFQCDSVSKMKRRVIHFSFLFVRLTNLLFSKYISYLYGIYYTCS